jgi:V8-like Glu-specific endopeptidase
MKRRHATGLVLIAVMIALAGGVWARAESPLQVEAADTCLPGDPFNLTQLAQVIERADPPTSPIVITNVMTVTYVHRGNMDDGDELMGEGGVARGPDEPREPNVSASDMAAVPMRIFNTRTGHEYRVEMTNAMLQTIHGCHERNGLTEAGGPADFGAIEGIFSSYLPAMHRDSTGGAASLAAVEAPIDPTGWSNNDDSRIVRTPTTLWPWRTITQSSSWPDGEQSRCTMTLIGPRHLVTAAHCIVDFRTSNWKSRKLTPARNGPSVEPYGVSRMTPNPPPGQSAWYIVPDPWVNPSTPNTIDRFQWDIGLVLMLDRLGDQTGWMGYGAYPASDLNTRYHYNRGYPGCQSDYSSRPAGCQIARLYGDTKRCDIGYYHHPGSNSWNRQFAFSCDVSRGHSGSPIYHYRFSPSKGKNVPVVTAVVSWHECLQCTANDSFPNHARRITPWVLGRISWLREQFP